MDLRLIYWGFMPAIGMAEVKAKKGNSSRAKIIQPILWPEVSKFVSPYAQHEWCMQTATLKHH